MHRYERAAIYVFFPFITNAILAASAFLNFADFSGHTAYCYVTVAAAAVGVGIAVYGFKSHDLGPAPLLFALGAHCVLIMVVFAGIYRGDGLLYSGVCEGALYIKQSETVCISGSSDWINPLYFSVVTWTTLGYGDFTPPHELRLIAAIEALSGYVFFGMVVGIATAMMIQRAER
jgi:hypothetical protein